MTRAGNTHLLVLDAGDILSDGLIYTGNSGEELKAFNVRDDYDIRCALISNIEVVIITGRRTRLVEDRCVTLGTTHLYQGQSNKLIIFSDLLERLAIVPGSVAYVGDDPVDWPVIEKVGLSVAVADAHSLSVPRASYITCIASDRGAAREICGLLLLMQGKLDRAKGRSI